MLSCHPQNRRQALGLGGLLVLGGLLLGCPPSAKSPDQKQEKASTAAGESGQAGAAEGDSAEKPEEEPQEPPPAPPVGGW